MKKDISRFCVITKKILPLNLLFKITYCKDRDDIFFNDKKIKGRSVYIDKNNIKMIPINKLKTIIFSRLKIKPNNQMIEKINNFLGKEI